MLLTMASYVVSILKSFSFIFMLSKLLLTGRGSVTALSSSELCASHKCDPRSTTCEGVPAAKYYICNCKKNFEPIPNDIRRCKGWLMKHSLYTVQTNKIGTTTSCSCSSTSLRITQNYHQYTRDTIVMNRINTIFHST